MKKIWVLGLILLIALSLMACDQSGDAVNPSKDQNVAENKSLIDNNKVNEGMERSDEALVYGDNKGFLWSVKSDTATVYLFGSIHLAEESLYPFHEWVEMAYEESDVLAVEANVSDILAAQKVATKMIYVGQETIYDHLSEAGVEKFETLCAEVGVKAKLFEKFRIWVAGSNLMSMQLLQSGFDASSGVDMYFLNKATKDRKEIFELEGIEFQIDLINGFSDEVQEEMFISSLGSKEASIDEFKKMYDYYLSGDEATMADYLLSSEGFSTDESVERAMLQDRNIGMAKHIESFLKTDQTYFVVVGLAHYLGDESVVELLQQKGYIVERK